MKRWLALFVCICMLGGVFSGCALPKETDKIVSELSQYSAEDRANMMAIAIPLVLLDSGLDLAKDLILQFNPDSQSVYNQLLKPIFKIIDQQTALDIVAQLYKIDETLRIKYFEGLYYRKEAKLTTKSKKVLERFFNEEILQVEGLSQILVEDGITVPVLAHFFGLFAELNGNTALLTDANETDFAAHTVSPLLDEIMFGMTKGEQTFAENVRLLANKLNLKYTAEEKLALKRALYEIRLYMPQPAYANKNNVAGGGVAGETGKIKNGFGYTVTTHSETDGDMVEVAYYRDGVAKFDQALTTPLMISVPVNKENIMLYAADGSPVKYTAYANGYLHCRIEHLGIYTLYEVAPYFTDANGWGKTYIEALFNRGIISGKGVGIFEPDAQITREEFVKLAVELFDLTDKSLTSDFKDVAADAWYAPYIASAKYHGIVNGISADSFGVGAPITRQDMCKILYGMLVKMELLDGAEGAQLPFNDTAMIADYAVSPVSTLVSLGIISGDDLGNFNPRSNATRQEAAKLIYGMLALYVQ